MISSIKLATSACKLHCKDFLERKRRSISLKKLGYVFLYIWNVALAISCSTTNEKFYSITESTCLDLRSSVNRKVSSWQPNYFPILICQDDAGTLFTNSISGKCTTSYLYEVRKQLLEKETCLLTKVIGEKSFPLFLCSQLMLEKSTCKN